MVTHDPSLTSRTHRNIIISDGELINETISRSLPQLRHRHMLEFTKIAVLRTYQPNETILLHNQPVDHFFMIRDGEVQMISQEKNKAEAILSRLGPGEFFGDIELLRGGKSIASVRAVDKPVSVFTLPQTDFLRVMQESPVTAETLEKIVEKKLKTLQAQ